MKRSSKYPDTPTFHFFNANPKFRITGDCVVRAVSGATGKSWDETFDALSAVAKKLKVMANDTPAYDRYLKSLGWVKRKQPRKADGTKFTGKEFCESLPEGHEPIVAHLGGHHVVCIRDKKVWDTWNSTGGCIGNWWQLPEKE